MADCLVHVALGAVTLLSWLGLGSIVLARGPRVGDPILDLLNRLGLGAVSFALVTFGAGWAGVLYRAAFLPVFAVTALVGTVSLGRWARVAPRPALRRWPLWQLGLLALLGGYIAIDLLAVCAPVSSPDALLYHVADPSLFAKAHRIFEIPWNSSSYEPFSVEMLVLDGLLLWNSTQAAIAPLLLAFVALVAVMGFAHRIAGRPAALLAGAAFFAQAFMVWEATSAFIEPGIALAVGLAAWNLIRFARDSERSGLLLSGVFAGGAAGMKYLGLIAALVLALVAVSTLFRRFTLRLALSFGLPAAAVALPWYVKNAVLTGNPFFPHVFGGLNGTAARELASSMRSFGYGRSVGDFLLLPARLLAAAKPFDGGQYLSPLFVIFAPVAVLLHRRRQTILIPFGAVLLFVVAWFLTTQQARFLVPAMPAAAVLAALGILALAQQGRLGRLVAIAVTAGALAVGAGASTVYARQFVPVVFGTEPPQRFLLEKVSNYNGVEWLNHNLGSRDRIATDLWALFYLRMPYVTFGTMGDLLPSGAGPSATRAFVAQYRVTHIAILDGDSARRRQVGYLDARLVGRISVRSVRSRTRGHFGRRHEMLVYAVRTR